MSPMSTAGQPLLQLEGLAKSFNGIPALNDITLSVFQGETLGLAGENGAGKSTLVNLLGGVLQPSRGRMLWNGSPYEPHTPKDAANAGLAFIHQELNLFPNLSIAENLFLPFLPARQGRKWGIVDKSTLAARAADALEAIGFHVSPWKGVASLSSGECQMVEIARALCQSAQLILLDEPTTSLTGREKERLFQLMGQLRDQGISMIFISHELGDLTARCDRLAVLRDGCLIGQAPAARLNSGKLISMMIGRSLDRAFPERSVAPDDSVLLEAKRYRSKRMGAPVNLQLRGKEILGIAGLMGSGRSSLLRGLFGLDTWKEGEIRVDGRVLMGSTPADCIRAGMALVTESRREDGLCMPSSVGTNMLLSSLDRFARRGFRWIRRDRAREAVLRLCQDVQMDRSARPEQPVRELSGGNQQKTVFAKWLVCQPRVFLLDEPTRGVDVGAKFEIYTLIDQLTKGGSSIIMVSSEVEELLGMCDRILVMRSGRVIRAFDREAFDQDAIMGAAIEG